MAGVWIRRSVKSEWADILSDRSRRRSSKIPVIPFKAP